MAGVKFFCPDTDAFVDSVSRHAAEFTETTGLDLKIEIINSDEYFSNKIHSYLDNGADVFMSGPVLLWEHIGAGYVEPLDEFVTRASTPFDFDDFCPSLIASNRWTGNFGDQLGTGSLWEIPVNCESYNLAYVPEILEKFSAEVPSTWEQYFANALDVQEKSNGAVRGFAQRGVHVWHTMYTGYASQFWSYGARDFDDAGKCVIASPEGVAATTDFINALRASGPTQWLDQRWYELALDFANEKYGFIVDSDHYNAMYEDDSLSQIKGRVGYALPPVGPGGKRESNMWTWSLVMNSKSSNKSNAWKFIEWASGKEFLLRSTFEGNMNPTRKSVWDDQTFRDASESWGDFYDVARQLVDHDARVLVTPTPHYLKLADRWVVALRSAFAGEDVAQALQSAARDIDLIVQGKSG